MTRESSKQYIPLSTPLLSGNEREYVLDCIDTGWISSVGKYVDMFESAFANYVGADGAVAASCGTAALHLALVACGVKPGDLVIVPTLTFIAPVNAITYVGASPLFIDCEAGSFGLCPAATARFIDEECSFNDGLLAHKASGRPVTAMLPVHLMGRSCDIDALDALCKKYRLAMIEDAAEGIGCLYKGRHVGTSGKAGCFSFNGNKTLTTGGGGMAVSPDASIRRRMKHLSTQAKSDELLFEHDETGFNYRMNNIQAALGLAQLESLDAMLERKRAIHKEYEKEFASLSNVRLLSAPETCQSACWFAVLKAAAPERRDHILKAFETERIQARPFWRLNHLHPMYRDCAKGTTPVAELLHSACVCFPCSARMSEDDVSRVVSLVKSFG